jgi:hypothetical protein
MIWLAFAIGFLAGVVTCVSWMAWYFNRGGPAR